MDSRQCDLRHNHCAMSLFNIVSPISFLVNFLPHVNSCNNFRQNPAQLHTYHEISYTNNKVWVIMVTVLIKLISENVPTQGVQSKTVDRDDYPALYSCTKKTNRPVNMHLDFCEYMSMAACTN